MNLSVATLVVAVDHHARLHPIADVRGRLLVPLPTPIPRLANTPVALTHPSMSEKCSEVP